jgi:hypothetical protein
VGVLLDVLEEDLKDGAPKPLPTESASAALEQHVTHLSRIFTQSSTGHVLFALIGHAQQDPATATALRDQVLARQHRCDRAQLADALAAGSASDPALQRHEPGQLLDLMVGPAFYRAFMTGQPVDPGFVRRLAATALAPPHGSQHTEGASSPGPSH